MAIENERKYILSLKTSFIPTLKNLLNATIYKLEQGYIENARVRSISRYNGSIDSLDDLSSTQNWTDNEYFFTWKQKRIKEPSLIEIETTIVPTDFNELFEQCSNKITKYRAKLDGFGVTWDIDFLFQKDISDHYITIAEAEMPEGWDVPSVLPDFVKTHLIYLVPREDDYRWTNKKLSDVPYVRRMLNEVKK
jgi:CYTH domain-containing protein